MARRPEVARSGARDAVSKPGNTVRLWAISSRWMTSAWAGSHGVPAGGLESWARHHNLAINTRRHLCVTDAESKVPSANAAMVSSMAASGSPGKSNTSFPARMASRMRGRSPTKSAKPFMLMASVNTSPSNPISSRSKLSTMSGDRVEGCASVLSRLGMSRWATMTAPMPWSKACANGASSMESKRARGWLMVGSVLCESLSLSPCPGKCLAVARTCTSCKPSA